MVVTVVRFSQIADHEQSPHCCQEEGSQTGTVILFNLGLLTPDHWLMSADHVGQMTLWCSRAFAAVAGKEPSV